MIVMWSHSGRSQRRQETFCWCSVDIASEHLDVQSSSLCPNKLNLETNIPYQIWHMALLDIHLHNFVLVRYLFVTSMRAPAAVARRRVTQQHGLYIDFYIFGCFHCQQTVTKCVCVCLSLSLSLCLQMDQEYRVTKFLSLLRDEGAWVQPLRTNHLHCHGSATQ